MKDYIESGINCHFNIDRPVVVTAELQTHHQIAALPTRMWRGELQILLITSRETKRWVIPKGWPMDGKTNADAAKQEAFEEAGACGRIVRKSLGTFNYFKRTKSGSEKPCCVQVFRLKVFNMKRHWPEMRERTREWCSIEEAAKRVGDDGLRELILKLN